MSNDLADRLKRAAPTPARAISAQQLTRDTSRRRHRQALGGAVLSLLVVAGALVGLLTGGDKSDQATIAAVPAESGLQISVVPGTGLVDGQTVRVSGSGFNAKATVAIVSCASESADLADPSTACATDRPRYAIADARGEFSTTYVIQRRITTPKTGSIDCASRPGRCHLGVGGVLSRKGVPGALTFRSGLPARAAPSVTMQTTGQLQDGSSVTVHGAGFGARQQVALGQCLTNSDCGGYEVVGTATADATGSFTATVTVHVKINTLYGEQAWCGQNCLLFAAQQPETSNVGAVTGSFSLVSPVPGNGVACALSTLKTSYGGLRTAAGGSTAMVVDLKNPAAAPCWINGYPHVQLLKMDGPPGGVGFFQGTSVPGKQRLGGTGMSEQPAWLRIDPQASAHFRLIKQACARGQAQGANFVDVSLAGGADIATLRIPAPDASLALPACSMSAADIFDVGPFVAGTG
jgi:hypothetical protein